MIAKRPTEKMHKLGIEENIIIKKGCYGFYLYDKNLTSQCGVTVRKESKDCIIDAQNGIRPILYIRA
jgi:hypothetical protein